MGGYQTSELKLFLTMWSELEIKCLTGMLIWKLEKLNCHLRLESKLLKVDLWHYGYKKWKRLFGTVYWIDILKF